MTTLSAKEIRTEVYNLIDETAETIEPILTTDKGNIAIIMSKENWSPDNETQFLMSIPGMTESILKGGATPIDECFESLE